MNSHGLGSSIVGLFPLMKKLRITALIQTLGQYDIQTYNSSLTVGGEEAVNNKSARLTVKDSNGCDCFFLDITLDQEIGGLQASRFFINIQNEFGPEAFTMFDIDVMPTQTFPFPDTTFAHLDLYSP